MRLGIFDSGEGGKNLVRILKRRAPHTDTVLLCDKGRAPYGTKSRDELVRIVENDIDILRTAGAQRILVACCTACTVYGELDEGTRSITTPIIGAAADAALKASDTGRIAVIATLATVRSHAFKSRLGDGCAAEIETQPLVGMVERGACDENATPEMQKYIELLLGPLRDKDADTLILGCTHFSSLANTVAEVAQKYGIRHVVDAAHEGAYAIPLDGFDADGIDYTMTTKATQRA